MPIHTAQNQKTSPKGYKGKRPIPNQKYMDREEKKQMIQKPKKEACAVNRHHLHVHHICQPRPEAVA